MAVVGIIGQTGGGFVKGADVSLAHSVGSSAMTDHGVVAQNDGKYYRVFEIKQSGTLTFSGNNLAKGILGDLCIVGGGCGGGSGGSNGGDGGKLLNYYGILLSNLTITIGAGGAGCSAGSQSAPTTGGNTVVARNEIVDIPPFMLVSGTGTGGGRGAFTSGAGATGDGYIKYPFNDSTYFAPHCGGAGGGASEDSYNNVYYKGGNGGTNGGNGASRTTATSTTYYGGLAGDSSAGHGGGITGDGIWTQSYGESAKYYGGGGGGGMISISDFPSYPSYTYSAGGNGYQGVVWLRIFDH